MRRSVITCPHGTEPQVLAKAKENYEEWMAGVKKGGIKPKAKGKKRKAKVTKFDELNKLAQRKYRESILAYLVAGASTASSTVLTIMPSTSTPTLSVPGPSVFILCTPMLTTVPPAHCVLPVPIQAAFPHITLQLGSALGDENCPTILCVVDMAPALSTSNLHFFATLAKAYPHTVASIHSPFGYSPITLSGISSITATLSPPTCLWHSGSTFLTSHKRGTPQAFLLQGDAMSPSTPSLACSSSSRPRWLLIPRFRWPNFVPLMRHFSH